MVRSVKNYFYSKTEEKRGVKMQIVKSAEYFLFANYSTQRSYRNQDATLKRKSPEHSFYRQICQKIPLLKNRRKKEV